MNIPVVGAPSVAEPVPSEPLVRMVVTGLLDPIGTLLVLQEMGWARTAACGIIDQLVAGQEVGFGTMSLREAQVSAAVLQNFMEVELRPA